MEFREATDRLMERVTLGDLAREMQVSESWMKQARMKEEADAHRPPPPREKWGPAVAALAKKRAAELLQLAEEVDG